MNSAHESGPSRETIHARLERLKQWVLSGSVITFGVLFALSAQHVVVASPGASTGGTASSGNDAGGYYQQQPQSQAPNGFFGGSDGNGGGGGLSQGNAPVVGSGGS